MLNHGVSTGALFLFVGFIYDRVTLVSSASLADGEFHALVLKRWFVIAALSSIGLPFLLNGFVGRFPDTHRTWTSQKFSSVRRYQARQQTGVIWALFTCCGCCSVCLRAIGE